MFKSQLLNPRFLSHKKQQLASIPELEITLAYHERTKHRPAQFAASLGYIDWKTQPNPFRQYVDAPLFPLLFPQVTAEVSYETAFKLGQVTPVGLDIMSISQLFIDSLALSAWKQAGANRWPLRINPSSGNLHPTECYLIAGPINGLHTKPAVYHYTPLKHSLEFRTELSEQAWQKLSAQLPSATVLLGLTSIHWRESWKYGERAFRYCQHDVGHAIGSIAVASAGLGWEARLLENVTDLELSTLLGVQDHTGVEAEHPDCLMAIIPQSADFTIDKQRAFSLSDLNDELRVAHWSGVPNQLSSDHHNWPIIDEVAIATKKLVPAGNSFWAQSTLKNASLKFDNSPLKLRNIIHQRRSAVAFDKDNKITRDAFYQILLKVIPGTQQIPFTTLPWHPCVDLLLFVHHVEGLSSGLYALLRDPSRKETLKEAMDPSFAWTLSEECPTSLPLFFLQEGDVRNLAQNTSCNQEIAAEGVFAMAMITEYKTNLEEFGSWFYRRLYWETGVVGQVLYLEAEAAGIRATGIGCFFDDLTHNTFGLKDNRFQVLYHFTMGEPIDDPRLQTHAPYQSMK
jgi:SagB-type dehydrogenase family enzyme